VPLDTLERLWRLRCSADRVGREFKRTSLASFGHCPLPLS